MNLRAQHYAQDLRRYYRLPATQVSLTVVLSLVVVAIFVSFALRPTFITIVKLRRTIAETQKTLTQLQTKSNNLQKAAELWEQIKPLDPILSRGIVKESAGYDPLVETIEEVAQATEVQLQSESLGSTLLFSRVVAPFKPKKDQTVIELPLMIKVVGSYPAVREFLNRITKIERLVGIETVSISRETGIQADNLVVSLTINGKIYYLGNQQQLKSLLDEKRRGR